MNTWPPLRASRSLQARAILFFFFRDAVTMKKKAEQAGEPPRAHPMAPSPSPSPKRPQPCRLRAPGRCTTSLLTAPPPHRHPPHRRAPRRGVGTRPRHVTWSPLPPVSRLYGGRIDRVGSPRLAGRQHGRAGSSAAARPNTVTPPRRPRRDGATRAML